MPPLKSPMDDLPTIEKPRVPALVVPLEGSEPAKVDRFTPTQPKPFVEPHATPSGIGPNRTPEPENITSNQESNIAINIASKISILRVELENLRSSAIKAQTFRFSEAELNQLKDRAYSLSRALNKKVTQGDLLRLGWLLFEKVNQIDRELMMEILKAI